MARLDTSDGALLKLYRRLHKEAFNERFSHEQQWQRNINFVLGRQWIYYHPRRKAWIDKQLAKWVPKPVTNLIGAGQETIHSLLQSVDLGVEVRPVGGSPDNIIAAAAASELQPLTHDDHEMDSVMDEADYWYITTGNVFLHEWWDPDHPRGSTQVSLEQCAGCGAVMSPEQLDPNGTQCPQCALTSDQVPGGRLFSPAIGQDGAPITQKRSTGGGRTDVLSPFEVAVAPNFHNFSDLPYVFRKRWRDKAYYENKLKDAPEVMKMITFSKAPHDRSLQIFRSFAQESTFATTSIGAEFNVGQHSDAEGVDEFELWLKPTNDFPEGMVMRAVDSGEGEAVIIPAEDEGLPGPLPFVDVKGNFVWPFQHAAFQRVGGRLWGVGPVDKVIQKQEHINQADSLIMLGINRMANPVWLKPSGAKVQFMTGEPGVVVEWDPLGSNGEAPTRLEGISPPAGLFQYRAQLVEDLEGLMGTQDILKGERPPNVESFAGMNLLQERAQSRFTSALKQRGKMYERWSTVALELERQFGPDERLEGILGPNGSWSMQKFENAQLQGSIQVRVEDGTSVPKTALGMRAAMAQAIEAGAMDLSKSDVRFTFLRKLGITDVEPSLDAATKGALKEQDDFEKWISEGAIQKGIPSPMLRKPWDDDMVHAVEHRKFFQSDRFRELANEADPQVAQFIGEAAATHLFEHEEILAIMAQQEMGAPAPPGNPNLQGPKGAAQGVLNSDQEAGGVDVAAEAGAVPA